MKKRSISLAAAALAVGIALTATTPANAATYSMGTRNCSGTSTPYVGLYIYSTGTIVLTINNGPSSWGKSYAYSSDFKAHHLAPATSVASSQYASNGSGTLGFPGVVSGCYTNVGWS
jgi:hypothetical protein